MLEFWWILLPGSTLLVVLLALVVKKGNARAADGARLLRHGGDLSPGPAWLKVSAVADGNLGISEEQGKRPTGTPTLQTRFVPLQVEGGPLVAIEPGHKLRILALGGAQRQLVETVTTAAGSTIARYSFEIPPGKPFFIAATIPLPVPQTSPFRGQQPVAVLRPVEGEYLVNEAGPQPFDWVALTIGVAFIGALGPGIAVGALIATLFVGRGAGALDVAVCVLLLVVPGISAIAARTQYPKALTPQG